MSTVLLSLMLLGALPGTTGAIGPAVAAGSRHILIDSPWARPFMAFLGAAEPAAHWAPRGSPSGSEPEGGLDSPNIMRYIVRWDSARRIREAQAHSKHTSRAAATTPDEYTISLILNGPLPLTVERRRPSEAVQNRIQATTTLCRKGHRCIHPLFTDFPTDGTSVLATFHFSKSDPIVPEDDVVEFVTTAAPVKIRVTFRLKDMLFDGMLDL